VICSSGSLESRLRRFRRERPLQVCGRAGIRMLSLPQRALCLLHVRDMVVGIGTARLHMMHRLLVHALIQNRSSKLH